ncbi:hypothetical protein [Halobacteriovorax sp. JY17]|uniref:hypothetical protein n=1 Tax=Halobacteriovorax sp. JY17 TaxID=2014617 RepID=UPI000C49AFFD|nr:hypothetical protein [Halobacteriovorax sp. JY17]PIK14042.1 MAG: hypothetical protein CES88_13745 [Halobacteriovorax sp. JY17]
MSKAFLILCVLISISLSYYFYDQYKSINSDFLVTSSQVEKDKARMILFEKKLKEIEESEREKLENLNKEKFLDLELSGNYCTTGSRRVLVNADGGILSAWNNVLPSESFNRESIAPFVAGTYHVLDKDSISLNVLKAERAEDIKNQILKVLKTESGSIESFSAKDDETGKNEVFSKKNCEGIRIVEETKELSIKFKEEYCSKKDSILKIKFTENRFKVWKLQSADQVRGVVVEGGEITGHQGEEVSFRTLFAAQEDADERGKIMISLDERGEFVESFYNISYPEEVFKTTNCK